TLGFKTEQTNRISSRSLRSARVFPPTMGEGGSTGLRGVANNRVQLKTASFVECFCSPTRSLQQVDKCIWVVSALVSWGLRLLLQIPGGGFVKKGREVQLATRNDRPAQLGKGYQCLGWRLMRDDREHARGITR